jgi:hypothetical protein
MRILTCHNSAFFRLLADFETVSAARVLGFLVALGRFRSPAQVSGPVADQDVPLGGGALITALASAIWTGANDHQSHGIAPSRNFRNAAARRMTFRKEAANAVFSAEKCSEVGA